MSGIVHNPKVKGWELALAFEKRVAAASFGVPEWPVPTPTSDPRRPRRVRIRRARRTARKAAVAVFDGFVFGAALFVLMVAPVSYGMGWL